MTTIANEVALIDQGKDLAHLNELVTEINTLKEGYKDLEIEGPEDTDGYEKVRLAIGVLRPKRTGLEAERKSVVKPYNDFVKHINSQYDVITTLIQDGPGGETELKQKKEAIDFIIKQQQEEEKRKLEEKINNRTSDLISKGMVFDGNWYVIGDRNLGISEITLGIADIRTMSDDLFQTTLQMVDDKAQKIVLEKKRLDDIAAKEKAEKEAAVKAEQDKIKADQDKLEQEKLEFDRKKREFDEQQAEFKKKQEEAELKERQAEQDRINAVIRHRSAILTGIGLEFNYNENSYDYKGETVFNDADRIVVYGNTEWLELIEKLKIVVNDKKIQAEQFLKKQEEDEKVRLQLQEQERLAGLSDKQKMQEYIDGLMLFPVPPLTTKTWKSKVAMIRDFISDNRPL